MEIFFGAFTSEWEQRRAALLHELSLGGQRRSSAEEELRKRMKALAELGAAGAGGGAANPGARRAAAKTHYAAVAQAAAAARPMEVRLQAVAQGSQPAVVKMASYGGGARVGAMLNYVSRGGELAVENENGERIRGRGDLASLRGDWDHLFQNRTESRDIAGFTVEITATVYASDIQMHELVRNTLSSGFTDRRFAYAVNRQVNGSLTVEGIVVLRSGQGERLTGDDKAASIIQSRYDNSDAAREAAARFVFQGYGNGVEYGASKLRSLVERYGGDVRDDRGQLIANDENAGDLVQKEWRGELHSRKSRDVMHLIMSARAGTDVEAFYGAVRDFLADQFGGHRYVFAMHDPAHDPKEERQGGKRPHVHAHAVITMRSESGDRIETTPAVFRQWRAAVAEKAREHGIAMEMTDRREFASPPAFTRNQVRPISREGRTEHVGTSEAAQARYDAKRTGRRTYAKSERSQQYTKKAKQNWEKVALASGDQRLIAYAVQQRDRLISGLSVGGAETTSNVVHADFGSNLRANLVILQKLVLEGEELREASRVEFEAYEKKVETALFNLERSVGPDERADFDEVATLAREHVNQRRELVELYEQRNEVRAEQKQEDQAEAEWQAAVAQDGDDAVDAGNDVLSVQDHSSDLIESSSAEKRQAAMEQPQMPKEELERAVQAEIDRLKAEGYSTAYICERSLEIEDGVRQRYAEAMQNPDNPDLVGAAKNREALIAGAERVGEQSAEQKDKTPTNADAVVEQQREPRLEEPERQPIDPDAREAHELASTVDATNRRQDRVSKGKEATQRGGETTRTDPAQQHIPRLEELERDEIERKERDRDDRER
ncbi:conjugal transfer protein TraA [Mesorhizobium sp.]|uniref:relaxase/mobilization nuclease domain-containing protein n=1 Tax=Mesorhizobium sp. TaxID=1871066 RepID=UPI000FE5216D|nr:conjugal transfer protein TraA [Mesorhizobium sp.]RWD10445.1 MAG: conjugal transfer protein TraA [Mesorhizobium sp.]RWF66319.1 MAG: conjugal transfer protein TraA [Mesorhizobium sp.]